MTEHEDQKELFKWADELKRIYPELDLMFAIPNGAKTKYYHNEATGATYSPQKTYLLSEGMKPGVPDIFLPCPRGGYSGLFIELKHGKRKASPAQLEYVEALRDEGYCCEVCTLQGAIDLILNYLGASDGIVYTEPEKDDM